MDDERAGRGFRLDELPWKALSRSSPELTGLRNHWLFLLFECRRETGRRRTTLLRARTALSQFNWTTALKFFGLIVVTAIFFTIFRLGIIILWTGVIGRIMHRLAKRRIVESILPIRATDLFSQGGYFEESVKDLWLCGMKGGDLVSAIAAESYSRMYWMMLVGACIVAIFIVACLFGQPAPWFLILLMSVGWYCWKWLRALPQAAMAESLEGSVQWLLKFWARGLRTASGWNETHFARNYMVWYILAAGVVWLPLLALYWFFLMKFESHFPRFFRDHPLEVLAATAFFAGGFVPGLLIRRSREALPSILAEYQDWGDRLMERFVCEEIIKEP